jgi:hypothetical protein
MSSQPKAENGFGWVTMEFNLIMAWSVDQLGRSLQDLIGFLSEIHAAGVDPS